MNPSNPEEVYATMSSYEDGKKVYKSTNAGGSWTNITGSLPNVPVNTIVYDENANNNALYVGTDVGVFYKDDSMDDWIPFYHNMPNVQVYELEI